MPLTATLVIFSFSSPILSFIPDIKPFSANPYTAAFLFLLQDSLHDSPCFSFRLFLLF